MPLLHPHATLLKFGYPDNLVHEGRHWAVLVRPAQPTLGSLILCSLSEATSYPELPEEAFVEQRHLVARIEDSLRLLTAFERVNYLMLMMVDPHVHFHVIPRYKGARTLNGTIYADTGWPALPDLANVVKATGPLVDAMRQTWGNAASN